MTEAKIKGCPFCGGKAFVHGYHWDGQMARGVVMCTVCHPTVLVSADGQTIRKAKKAAREKWNTRHE